VPRRPLNKVRRGAQLEHVALVRILSAHAHTRKQRVGQGVKRARESGRDTRF
jgi:hypothetical protein